MNTSNSLVIETRDLSKAYKELPGFHGSNHPALPA